MSDQQFDLSELRNKLPEFNLGAIKWLFLALIVISALLTSIY